MSSLMLMLFGNNYNKHTVTLLTVCFHSSVVFKRMHGHESELYIIIALPPLLFPPTGGFLSKL